MFMLFDNKYLYPDKTEASNSTSRKTAPTTPCTMEQVHYN
jgi:hypothetical protein